MGIRSIIGQMFPIVSVIFPSKHTQKIAAKSASETNRGLICIANKLFVKNKASCTYDIINESLYPSRYNTVKNGYTVKSAWDSDIRELRKDLNLPPCYINSVLLYSKDSDFSKKLSNLASVKSAVSEWKSGKVKDENGNVKNKFVICVNDDKDTKWALNGCTISGLKENPDGTVTGYIWDKWDFDENYTDQNGGSKDLSLPNKIACNLQGSGILANFQLLIPITVKP